MQATTTKLRFLFALFLCSIFYFSCVQSQGFTVGPSANPAPVTDAAIAKISNLSQVMYNMWYSYDAACDPKAVFAVAYLYMTANAKKLVEHGYFDDGDKMVDFVSTFAGRFLAATDSWEAGNTAVSDPWHVYFAFLESNRSDVTQDLTIGMDAHINYDLPIAAYQQGYAVPAWTSDYYRVNDLMAQVDVNVTHALGRYDPEFYNTDWVSTAYFNASIDLVTSWRTSAYATAVGYQDCPPPTSVTVPAAMHDCEISVAATGSGIARPYTYDTSPSRIAYCQANHYPLEV